MKKIMVRGFGDGYHASIKDEPGRWAAGKSSNEAIGELIRSHQEAFEVTIEDNTRPQPHP